MNTNKNTEILDNGEEWDVVPENTILPPECEVSFWEALPFTIFAAVGVIAIIGSAIYRVYQFFSA